MVRGMSLLQKTAKAAILQYGNTSRAARALKINRTLLSLLANGDRKSCSPGTLRKLGLRPAGYEAVT
jgi:hypothetical protein